MLNEERVCLWNSACPSTRQWVCPQQVRTESHSSGLSWRVNKTSVIQVREGSGALWGLRHTNTFVQQTQHRRDR